MKLLSSYGRTRDEVLKKVGLTMLSYPSTASSISMSNVSGLPSNFVDEFMAALFKKYDESQQLIQNVLISIDEKIQSLEKGKRVDNSYSIETLNANSSAALTYTSQPLYGMSLNHFAGSHRCHVRPYQAWPNRSNRFK